jgi:hypothetical protein
MLDGTQLMAGQTLRDIHAFPDLVRYLEDELDWPLQEYGFDELTFEFTPAELGLKEEDAARVKAIHQLRPLASGQPWGIFFVEFENKKLPVVVLRRILSHLVVKKRDSANKATAPAWHAEDLLFVTAFGEDNTDNREIAFAHFHQTAGDLPTLHVLGWDGSDTPLKLAKVDSDLRQRLRWPEDESDAKAWREYWSKPFKHKLGHTIRTADLLAEELARLARGIRDKAKRMLAAETERGALTKLFKAFQTALIHDLTPENFADTYAQTITYGLLTAAISRTEMSEGRHGTALIAENVVDMVPVTNPFLKEMLQTFLKVGGRKGGIDFDELGIQDVVELLRGDETDLPAILRDFGNRTRGEDPVIHFYEHFLSAYNKQLKIQRGVFYTPQPVVSYIVRSVHELLQSEFGLADGLADTTTWGEMLKKHPEMKLPPLTDEAGEQRSISPDEPFVQILDPATGTATFLVEVIDVIHRTLTAKWKQQNRNAAQQQTAWNDYVPKHLLPRLHAYELMMAPYAIAHMKMGLKLAETGYRFGTEERARIYLTNALEPWQRQLTLRDFEALAHEATAVNEIKQHKRFTVVIGNPPYSGISSNMSEYAQRIVDAYRFADGAALNEKKLWLQDDYVKFIRKAQTTIENARVGVFGFITNHGYLDNPTFRGMRQSLMGTFQQMHLLDLHGNANKKELPPDGSEDKNVFDIRQGVAICLATRGSANATIKHADLWGSRETKYGWLTKHHVGNSTFSTLTPDSPYYFFESQNTDCRAEYDKGWKINDAMPVNSAGFITARDHFVVDFDQEALLSRIAEFANPKLSDTEIRTKYFAGCGSAKYPDGDTRGWKIPSARKRVQADKLSRDRVRRCLYRPFDERQIYWVDWMVDWPRPELTRHLEIRGNKALITTRITQDIFSVFVSDLPPAHKSVSAYDVNYVFPLTAAPSSAAQSSLLFDDGKRHSNFAPTFLKALASAVQVPQAEAGLPQTFTPEDIFHYAYAVFHSPGYRNRYAEFLKIDFPRLPLTGSLELFRALAQLGSELVALHLLESPKINNFITRFEGQGDNSIPKKSIYKDGAVWINASQRFEGVPEAVWNFHVGGYQVCEKWLKDRKGRTLSADDIAHYQRVVVALNETIRLMAEIDAVIEAHGGWPGAFQSAAETMVPV